MSEFFASIINSPSVQQMGLYLGLVFFGMLILYTAGKVRDALSGTDPIVVALQNILNAAIDGAYLAIEGQLSKLAHDQQIETIRRLAHDLYIQFPPVIQIPMGRYTVSIPLKILLSEELFTEICLASYYRVSDTLLMLEQELLTRYREWKGMGSPLPNGGIAVRLGG
jgi:hypothetical protein